MYITVVIYRFVQAEIVANSEIVANDRVDAISNMHILPLARNSAYKIDQAYFAVWVL